MRFLFLTLITATFTLFSHASEVAPDHLWPQGLDAEEVFPQRENMNVSLLAHLAEGPSADVAVSGNITLLGHGGYLELLDFSDPTSPSLLNRHRIEGFITAIDVSGNLAVVSTLQRGIHLLDITDPPSPDSVSFIPFDGYLRKLVIKGSLLYYCLAQSFHIVDITDPTVPVELGVFERPNLGVFSIWGYRVYINESPGNLLILNVEDPTSPFVENTLWAEPGFPQYRAIECADGLLHGIRWDLYGFHSFRIYNLADPAFPVPLSQLDGDLDLHNLAIEGSWLHFITEDSLLLYDSSNPVDPKQVDSAPVWDNPLEIDVRADLVFVAEPDFGLQCFTTGIHLSEDDIVELSRFDEGFHGACTDVVLVGDLLVASATAPGLATYDVSDPSDPVLLGSIYDHVPGTADTRGFGLSVQHDQAYLRCSDAAGSWLRVIDISDPASPVELASLPGSLMNIQFRNDIGYSVLNSGINELHVDNFADPSAPIPVTILPLSDWSAHLVSGDRLLVATGDDLVVYDISDPQFLIPLGQADLAWGSPTNFVTVTGDSELAYFVGALSQDPDAMRIVDFSNPEAIAVHLGPIVAGSPSDITHDNGFLYLAIGSGGMEAYSLEDPLVPELVGQYRTGSWGWGISGTGQAICVADSEDGIYILRNDLSITGVNETQVPGSRLTLSNHPNPFNPRTKLVFNLPVREYASLRVYDARGRLARILMEDIRQEGLHEIFWDGRDDKGRALPAGVYLARLETRELLVTKSLTLVK